MRLVDTDKLKDEVGETAEIEYDDNNLTWPVFVTSAEGSHQQDGDSDRNGGDGESEFRVILLHNHDNKLDDEAKEEEEIEFEKGDVDLQSSWLVLGGKSLIAG